MLNRLPKDTPPLAEMMRDIGATCHQLAGALHVSPRTVQRWIATNSPRSALLAVWWISAAGFETWDSEMFARATLALSLNASLQEERKKLLAEIARLSTLSSYGSANDQRVQTAIVVADRRAACGTSGQAPS